MPFTQLTLNTRIPLPIGASKGRPALRKVADLIEKALAGTGTVDSWLVLNDNTPKSGTTDAGVATRAVAGLVLSSGTGAVGGVINGTSVTATWATSDTNSAGLIEAAINANTTVNPFVAATKYLATVTCASVAAGDSLQVCGATFTATAAATGKQYEFARSGNNTTDATNLAAAINRSPLNTKLVASSNAAIVYIGLAENRVARSDEILGAASSTFTLSQFAARTSLLIFARQPGLLGNCCTVTATGTGVTAFSAVSGKLGGGLGGYLSTAQYLSSDTR